LFFKAVRAALALTTSISELIREERATQKNSQLATARRVAMKKWAGGGVARRSRIDSDMLRSYRQSGSDRLADGPF
jgi:hypothetical protein